jgi:hypothetical protein
MHGRFQLRLMHTMPWVPRIHRVQKPGTTIRMVTRSVITSAPAQHAAQKFAVDANPAAGLDGYQMLWLWI